MRWTVVPRFCNAVVAMSLAIAIAMLILPQLAVSAEPIDQLAYAPNPRESAPKAAILDDANERLKNLLVEPEASPVIQATTVTLRGKRMPVAEVLKAIVIQTGNQVTVDERLGKIEVDLFLDRAPFWQALDVVADAAELAVGDSNEKSLILYQRGEMLPRKDNAVYAGPLRFCPTAIQARRDLRSAEAGNMRVSVEVSWEPRLRPIVLIQPFKSLQAIDDKQQNLVFDGLAEGSIAVQLDADSASSAYDIPLKLPDRTVQSISSLKGKLNLLAAGKVETFTFDKLDGAKPIDKKLGNATVTLEDVRKNQDIWEVRMRIKFAETADSLAPHLASWVLDNEATEGKVVTNEGFETTALSTNEVGVAYLFDLPDGPAKYKFVYRSAATVHVLPIEYELRDLKLP